MRGKSQKHRDEQAENDAFVRAVGGVKRADRMQQIWNSSYPEGRRLDLISFHPKEEVFRRRAKEEGFTGLQVNRFLDLP